MGAKSLGTGGLRKFVRHAGEQALDALESLLEEVRKQKSLRERKRGIFYKGPTAFLHFHEDPAGIFADLRRESTG